MIKQRISKLSEKIVAGTSIYLPMIMTAIISLFLQSRPFFQPLAEHDQAIFQYYGKGMIAGLLPYKDIFDNKGPMLFFIEYLGQLLPNNMALFIIEIAFLFLWFYFQVKVMKSFLTNKNIWLANSVTIIIMILLTIYGGGNTDEEFAVGPIAFAIWFAMRYLNNKASYLQVLLFGLTFSFVAQIKLSLIAPLLAIGLFMAIDRITKKQLSLLIKEIMVFIAGNLIIEIPLFWYFIKNHILSEMIYQSVIFNGQYTKDSANFLSVCGSVSFFAVISMILWGSPIVLIIFSKRIFKNYKDYLTQDIILELMIVLSFIADFISIAMAGRPYYHYVIPAIPVASWLVFYFTSKYPLSSDIKREQHIISSILVSGVLSFSAYLMLLFFLVGGAKTPDYHVALSNYVISHVKNKNATMYSTDPCFYSTIPLFNSNKYYATPVIHYKKNSLLVSDMRKSFYNKEPDIYLYTKGYNNWKVIKKLAKQELRDYKLVKSFKNQRIYIIKNKVKQIWR